MADNSNTIKKKLLKNLEKSLGIVTEACKNTGCSRTFFYDHYNNDPDFKKEVDALQDVALDHVESQLHKQIDEGSTAGTIFYLKTKGKKRGYVERQEITGADGEPLIDDIDYSKLKKETIADLLNARKTPKEE